MAKGYYLVCGDKTTCGGIITEGDTTEMIFRKATARESDRVTCGVHPGMYIIVGHVGNDNLRGRKYAGSLDSFSSCPCKARFIPSMLTHTYEFRPVTAKSSESNSSGQAAKNPMLDFAPSFTGVGICERENNSLKNGVFIWTETQEAGHSFVSVHENNTIHVYTYGRFGRRGTLTLTGDGILNYLVGDDASLYYREELYKTGAKVFIINDADIKVTREFFEGLWNAGSIPVVTANMGERTKHRGKVIDIYDLTGNNCTTHTVKAIREAGSKIFQTSYTPIITQFPIQGEEDFTIPISLQKYLVGKSKELSSMTVFDVTKEFIKQYPNVENFKPRASDLTSDITEGLTDGVSKIGSSSGYSGGTIGGVLGGSYDLE